MSSPLSTAESAMRRGFLPVAPARTPVQRDAPAYGTISGPMALGWGVCWAILGCLVAAGIAFARESGDLGALMRVSVLFAEVVGFTALTSARLVFPYFTRLRLFARLGLQVVTLFSGTVFGSLAIALTQPLFSLAQFRTIGMLVAVNAGIAVVVGLALHTYDSMRREIEASYRALREKEALEREIAIARDVQRQLLPRGVPRVAGLELAGTCLPAIGVGGDYFDWLPFPGDQVGLIVADVSGKGIPAALLMAGLQASFRSVAPAGVPPAEIVSRLNGILFESTSDARYATLFLGLLDARRRSLTYCNAGHYPPLHLGRGGRTRLESGGFPIGLFADARYEQGRCDLEAGDLLTLYTDGIVEAPDAAEELFGEERLARILLEHRDEDLDRLVGIVLDEVARWSGDGPRHDDITLVLARVR